MTWTLDFADAYPRKMRSGDSEVYLGALDAVVISKVFTAGEDAAMAWLQAQDDATLVTIYALPDGRDLILLRRSHTKQSLYAAVMEHQEHIARTLHASMGVNAT